ncbi:MAG TPA: DUF3467 domain-containing protein [Propionibacteriaceae bacterium]|jgi:hypothetical protein|nr:DUF3467 domain-containing protein [Propionibacteriaceae bacterium]
MSDRIDVSEEASRTVSVRVPAENRHGTYANVSLVSHSGHEFTIDFCQTEPASTADPIPAYVVSRLHLPPTLIPSLISALQGNVNAYQQQFGPIVEVH